MVIRKKYCTSEFGYLFGGVVLILVFVNHWLKLGSFPALGYWGICNSSCVSLEQFNPMASLSRVLTEQITSKIYIVSISTFGLGGFGFYLQNP